MAGNFKASALKYRPLRFDEVVGQQHVSQTLKNALRTDHLAHAFLFCGPRGVGKTTCARILAKVLNCKNANETFEPCNTCSSCEAFNHNASFNITELDAASNNSVEHIRALIEQVRFQPQQGKYKVFIIDEVHMLSQQAFNAFLKTLEEPPSYAIFILATTEKHKIIPTILSRCQIFDFKRIQIPEMVAHLSSICQDEGIAADPDALHIIAQKADGALRDALSIFDRVVSYSGKEITYQDVITNLNFLDYDYYFQVVDGFLVSDTAQVLLLFDKILKNGFEPDVFLQGLSEHIRNLLVCKSERTTSLLEVGEKLQERYKEQARISPKGLLLSLLAIANDCDVNYKMARNKRLHLEMALIRMCHINQAISIATTASVPSTEKKNLDSSSPSPQAPSLTKNNASSTPPLVKKKNLNNRLSQSPKFMDINSISKLIVEDEAQKIEAKPLNLETLEPVWLAYAEKIDTISLKNTLKNAPLAIEGKKIICEVGGKVAKASLEADRQLVEHLQNALGRTDFSLIIRVNRDLAPKIEDKRPKKKNAKQIYQEMLAENQHIASLVEAFDLRPS